MKNLFFVVFSLLSALTNGQTKKFTFKLGPEYELPNKSEDLAFFGNNKDGIINLSMIDGQLDILKFDPQSLSQTSNNNIELQKGAAYFNSEIAINLGANYYWLYSFWDKEMEKETLFYDKINIETGKAELLDKKLIQTTKIAGTPILSNPKSFSIKMVDKFTYNFDVNHKYLLVSYKLIPEEKNDKLNYDILGFYVFDENMQKVWGNQFTMPFTERTMDISDFSVDVQGNAYMLAKVYDSDKRSEVNKETGQAGYVYEMMKFKMGSKKIIHTPIAVEDVFIKEANLVQNAAHEMIIACTYSKKSKGNSTDGIYLATIDSTGKSKKFKSGYYEFPLEELVKFESAKAKRKIENKDNYEAPNIKIRDVYSGQDGSVFIVAEEFSVVEVRQTQFNGYSSTNPNPNSSISGNGYVSKGSSHSYFYGDILTARINASGKFEWLRKIPKMQEANYVIAYNRWKPYKGTLSFKSLYDSSGYYFLYLDNKKNIDLPVDESPKSYIDGIGGQVIVSKIDLSGNVTKELLFDTKEEEVKIFPADFSLINKNQFIGRAKLKKNIYKPLLITVN